MYQSMIILRNYFEQAYNIDALFFKKKKKEKKTKKQAA